MVNVSSTVVLRRKKFFCSVSCGCEPFRSILTVYLTEVHSARGYRGCQQRSNCKWKTNWPIEAATDKKNKKIRLKVWVSFTYQQARPTGALHVGGVLSPGYLGPWWALSTTVQNMWNFVETVKKKIRSIPDSFHLSRGKATSGLSSSKVLFFLLSEKKKWENQIPFPERLKRTASTRGWPEIGGKESMVSLHENCTHSGEEEPEGFRKRRRNAKDDQKVKGNNQRELRNNDKNE